MTNRTGFHRQNMWPDLTISAVLLLMACSGLIAVYGSVTLWLMLAVPSILLGNLAAACSMIRNPGRALLAQLSILGMAQLVIGPSLACPETTVAGMIPTAATVTAGARATVTSFKTLIAVMPPVGLTDGAGMALWTSGVWLSLAAGSLITASSVRLRLCAPVPVALMGVASALLGVSRHETAVWHGAGGIMVTATVVTWAALRVRRQPHTEQHVYAGQTAHADRFTHANQLHTGQPVHAHTLRLSGMLTVSTLAAAAVCMAFPAQHRFALRDWYNPPLQLTQITSPLSRMRGYLRHHADDVMLTVSGLPGGTAVRVAVMDVFDGTLWNLAAAVNEHADSRFRRIGAAVPHDDPALPADTAAGRPFTARMVIGTGWKDWWLPLAGNPDTIRFAHARYAQHLYMDTATQTALMAGGLTPGMAYTVTGTLPRTPSRARLDRAAAARLIGHDPQHVPEVVRQAAVTLSSGSTVTAQSTRENSHQTDQLSHAPAGRTARILAERLAAVGWFSHGGDGEYASPPGHGYARLTQMFSRTILIGDSEQYASAMALMARTLGIPSRVVLGFTVPQQHTVRFTGADLHAWTEINLQRAGWVAFDPVPDESRHPAQEPAQTFSDPEPVPQQLPPPLPRPLKDETPPNSAHASGGEDAHPADLRQQSPAAAGRLAALILLATSPIWLASGVMALLLSIRARALARQRGEGTPRMRVLAGWQVLVALARRSGISLPAGATRPAQAAVLTQILAEPTALTLAQRADEAAFAGRQPTAQQAARFWKDVDRMRAIILARQPPLRRLYARLA